MEPKRDELDAVIDEIEEQLFRDERSWLIEQNQKLRFLLDGEIDKRRSAVRMMRVFFVLAVLLSAVVAALALPPDWYLRLMRSIYQVAFR